ncbi:MAG: hypothetical protein O7B35_11680 [Deltaproteobacteria bacterium]|nr:hypothetical protein [Deltaproteobacteria bacterium]
MRRQAFRINYFGGEYTTWAYYVNVRQHPGGRKNVVDVYYAIAIQKSER